MTYKSLIFAALLLPSIACSISKDDQIKQLKNQMHVIEVEIAHLHEGLAYEAFLSFMGGKDGSLAKSIVKELRKQQKELLKVQRLLLKLGVKDTDEESYSEDCCSEKSGK